VSSKPQDAIHPIVEHQLSSCGPGIWSRARALSVVGVQLGTRSTIVRLPDGGLWVHSPSLLEAGLANELDAVGRVEFLVVPNRNHHLFVAAYRDAYPTARIAAPRALAEKLGATLALNADDASPTAWESEIDQVRIRGIRSLDETAFFHRASGTLILTDLCFNLGGDRPWLTRMTMRANRAWNQFGPTRLLRASIVDHAALRSSIDEIARWPIRRISVCHGDAVDIDARERFLRAFEFLDDF